MGNISNERKYRLIASRIDVFMIDLVGKTATSMKFKNAADREIIDLLIAAQNKALDLAISFEDKIKENT